YGKMGRAIEAIAVKRGHTITLTIDINNLDDFTPENLSKADVAIEFTSPHTAFDNVVKCIEAGISLVCGSTGWLSHWDEVVKFVHLKEGAMVYSSNYSVGVNIFFELNKKLAALMNTHDEYNITMHEIHHTQKKDAPSGTAVTLAEQVLEHLRRKKGWVNELTTDPDQLQITSERIDPAPGTHMVKYESSIDSIEIIHTANNREGFATGAVLAAEYIKDKKGIFSMQEVLGL
ncbi:MAG: 4-hydroxy-tetrahydrodipicolinate reductase, partial [Gemmatimonadaceae bacterium]|nr:4-hydroxy-tetrahydrodipicolinate reductase [Chitinophagaceae bacterium]